MTAKKKRRPRGRPKLKPGSRGVYQLSFFKYFKKGASDDKNKS